MIHKRVGWEKASGGMWQSSYRSFALKDKQHMVNSHIFLLYSATHLIPTVLTFLHPTEFRVLILLSLQELLLHTTVRHADITHTHIYTCSS